MENGKIDLSDKKLLYDPLFDSDARAAAQVRKKSKKLKLIFAIFIVTFIGISLYFSFHSISHDKYVFSETDDGLLMYQQFNGQPEDKILYCDYKRDADGNTPEKDKPVKVIKEYAVNCNEYLNFIYIGKDVEKLDSTSFFTCKNLYAYIVEEGNESFESINGVLYGKENGKITKLISCPAKYAFLLLACENGAKLPETIEQAENFLAFVADENNKEKLDTVYTEFSFDYEMPESVTSIGRMGFIYCEKLRNIRLHEGITEVASMAFFKVGTILALDLPSSLEIIGSDAFSYLKEVKYIYIPDSVKSIGHHAFFGCGASEIHMQCSEDYADNNMEIGPDWIPKTRKVFEKNIPVLYSQEKKEV